MACSCKQSSVCLDIGPWPLINSRILPLKYTSPNVPIHCLSRGHLVTESSWWAWWLMDSCHAWLIFITLSTSACSSRDRVWVKLCAYYVHTWYSYMEPPSYALVRPVTHALYKQLHIVFFFSEGWPKFNTCEERRLYAGTYVCCAYLSGIEEAPTH